MADWRQIQARIRKAKNSPEAHAKLSDLYQRTRDAMVAWELGVIEEKANKNEDAGKWYTIALERFRRADWKKKAEEALGRLGIELPPAKAGEHHSAGMNSEAAPADSRDTEKDKQPLAVGEVSLDEEESGEESEEEGEEKNLTTDAIAASSAAQAPGEDATGVKKKRRRGRRGGRGRRRKGTTATPSGLPSQAFAEASGSSETAPLRPQLVRPAIHEGAPVSERPQVSDRPTVSERPRAEARHPEPPRVKRHEEVAVPQLPSERTAHGRAGDPALASRMVHLESILRRLLASPLHRLDQADEAPAGPGVFLLSDADQTASYYVESCQTLRVGIGNLARGGRGGKTGRSGRGFNDADLKSKLAEHLGIGEAKVSQYMKDHCVVRWVQLDDDAAYLANFAISVLRTPLNLD